VRLNYMKKLISNILLTFRFAFGKTKIYISGLKKSRVTIIIELLNWQFTERYFNRMYYGFGLNIRGTRQDDFIGRRTFIKAKQAVESLLKEKAGCKEFNYDIITKDKFLANSYFSANGIPCFENLAMILDTKIRFKDGTVRELDALAETNGVYYIKNIVLEAGDGIIQLNTSDKTLIIKNEVFPLSKLNEKTGKGIWVLQQQYHSHDEIKKVNSSALNTTRIVTILDGNEPEYLTGFQAFATNGSTNDSWNNGSIYVGIDIKNSCLKEYGYYSLHVKNKSLVSSHPDSGIIFKGYPLPFLKEAVELCLKAHRLLYFNFIVGWDVAITNDGPFIVEANEKPGMNAVQCIDGGLKRKIMENADRYLSR
jgi:hypothetical protein